MKKKFLSVLVVLCAVACLLCCFINLLSNQILREANLALQSTSDKTMYYFPVIIITCVEGIAALASWLVNKFNPDISKGCRTAIVILIIGDVLIMIPQILIYFSIARELKFGDLILSSLIFHCLTCAIILHSCLKKAKPDEI